mmetsp:Transcript_96068/g.256703  ORF Transcript_96068/g.256703 Transcript_96068/m.256703 type:complete len:251 (-) Transcript_96068:1684-2436(-)
MDTSAAGSSSPFSSASISLSRGLNSRTFCQYSCRYAIIFCGHFRRQFFTFFTDFVHRIPWFGSAAQNRRSTSLCCPGSPWDSSKAMYPPQAWPRAGFSCTARMNHFRAFAIFPSLQNSWATATMTSASFSHFLRASTLLAFWAGLGSRSMAWAQSTPLEGHSWRAFDIMCSATRSCPSILSTSTPRSHSNSDFGFLIRAFSSNDRALGNFPSRISHSAAHSHTGTDLGQARTARSKNRRASASCGGVCSM